MDTPPTPDLPLEYGDPGHTPTPRPQAGNGLRLAVGGAIAVLVAVVGFIAVSQFSTASGADSPEAAVQALADAINDEDLDAVTEALVPGERDALADPIDDLLAELGRIGILTTGIDTSTIPGLDLEIIDLSMLPTSIADDLATVRVTGTLRATFFGRELPFGQALIETSGDTGLDLDNIPSPPPTPLDITLATVRRDGSWYVSIAYTIAELQRTETGWPLPDPSQALEPQGAESPEAFVEAFVAAAEGLDIASLIAQLNPGEAEAAHRYAPSFLLNNASSWAEGNTTIEISDLEYRIDVDGDWADVHIDTMTMVTTQDDEWMGVMTLTTRYADGCVNSHATYEDMDESDQYDDGYEPFLPPGYTLEDDGSLTVCPVDGSPSGTLGILGAGLLGGGASPPTLGLANHDGRWYLSPTRTIANQLLTALRQTDDGAGAELIRSMFMPWGSTGFETTFVETGEEITATTVIVSQAEVTDTTLAEE